MEINFESIGFIITSVTTVALTITTVIAAIKNKGSVQIGSLRMDFSKKESINEPKGKSEKSVFEAKKIVEDYTRSILSKQFDQVVPFLSSLRPIFNRLCYSILNDAMIESLGIEKETRIPLKNEKSDIPGSHYKVETVKTYVAEPQTRVFTNLVESTVDSLMGKVEREVYNMLVNNNIGKTREEVRAYIHLKSENLIGVVRNCLCEAYNNLSNKNLFDTKKYWAETGITYPTDWLEDKLYHLFVLCLQCRYNDFDN